MKQTWNFGQLLSVGILFLQFAPSLAKIPVASTCIYPHGMTCLSGMILLPCGPHYLPALSCVYIDTIGEGGAHCVFILSLFAARWDIPALLHFV